MDECQALIAFAALSEATRLSILRLLVQSGRRGLSAGEIAARLDVPPPRLSFHLRTLEAASLIAGTRKGRHIIYCVAFATLEDLVAYVLEECCGGGHSENDCCTEDDK